MNQIITAPPSAQVPCPVCCGSRSHPDQPPGQVWDDVFERPVDCWECDGAGFITDEGLAELARETQDAALLALVAERDPALSPAEVLREMGFTHLGGSIL